MTDIVQKLWGFCHTLRHDGIDYGDYIEQITYLLFIKMADERDVKLPKGCDWKTLMEKSGTDLSDHYVDVLRTLGQQTGSSWRYLCRRTLAVHEPGELKETDRPDR